MQIARILLMLVVFSLMPLAAFSADAHGAATHGAPLEGTPAQAHADSGHHGLPLYAVPLKDFGFFKITNSMLVTWVVAILLIIFAQVATRNIKRIPEGAQNFWEWLVEGLYNFLEGIIGHELVKKTFWFFATIFIMILACNWFGLIPGVGSIGWGTPGPDGKLHHISEPILRGANADMNMTMAMAMVFFACWIAARQTATAAPRATSPCGATFVLSR